MRYKDEKSAYLITIEGNKIRGDNLVFTVGCQFHIGKDRYIITHIVEDGYLFKPYPVSNRYNSRKYK